MNCQVEINCYENFNGVNGGHVVNYFLGWCYIVFYQKYKI